MNTKTILGISLAAVFAVVMIGTPAFAGGYPSWTVVSGNSDDTKGNITILTVDTGDVIPKRADDFVAANAVVGFAWAHSVAGDPDTFELVVATIHPTLGRDSHQNPNAWHTHTATLNADLTCLLSIDSTPEGGLSINKDSMSVRIKNADLPSNFSVDAAVGFALNGDEGCPDVPGLGFGVGVTLLT